MNGPIWLQWWNVTRELAEYRVLSFPTLLVPFALFFEQDPDQNQKDSEWAA